MTSRAIFALLCTLPALVVSTDNNNIRTDPLSEDPNLSVTHLYKNQWPTGIAISSSGRMFSCFPAGLDELNTNLGNNSVFQLAELDSFDTEKAYPDDSTNNPPGGCVDTSGDFAVSKGLSNYLLSVQSVIVDKRDRLYALDTGRCLYNGVLTDASPGGPKIVIFDLNNDQIIQTFIFPSDVALPTSYLLDITVWEDKDIAFVSDGSPSGNYAIIVCFLSTGESYRVLVNDFSVSPEYGFLAFVWGDPIYQLQRSGSGEPIGPIFPRYGVDGMTLSSSKQTLYYTPFASRFFYSVPTSLLIDRNVSETERSSGVRSLGEFGFCGGMASSTNETIFCGQGENDGVIQYNPNTQLVTPLVHDPRINFVDRFALLGNNISFIVNQLNYLPIVYPGTGDYGVDRRQKPYVLFTYPLEPGVNEGVGN